MQGHGGENAKEKQATERRAGDAELGPLPSRGSTTWSVAFDLVAGALVAAAEQVNDATMDGQTGSLLHLTEHRGITLQQLNDIARLAVYFQLERGRKAKMSESLLSAVPAPMIAGGRRYWTYSC